MNTNRPENLAALENLFLTLGDKTRLRLLALMAAGPVTVSSLVHDLGDSQPKVSRHLAYMREHGYVTARRDGKCIYYGIKEPQSDGTRQILSSIVRALGGPGTKFMPSADDRYFGETLAIGVDTEARFGAPITVPGEDLVSEPVPDAYSWSDRLDDNERQAENELEVFLL